MAAEVEMLGGGDARTVELEAGEGQASLTGGLTFLIRNTSSKDARLTVRFVPAGTSTQLRPLGSQDWIYLESKGRRAGSLLLRSKEARPVAVRFALAQGQGPRAVDGELILSMRGEVKTIALTGTMRQFKGVKVDPPSLTMDSDQGSATVTLTGPELVEFLRAAGPDAPEALLRDDDGDSTGVKVMLPSAGEVAASTTPTRAEATVKLIDDPSPGKYSGSVPLSSLVPEAPAIKVDLNSHSCFGLLVLLAFVGVFVGGLLTRLVTLAMRRSLLLKVLGESLAAYRHALTSGRTRSWRLEDLLDVDVDGKPRSQAGSEARLQGLSGLTNSIETARSGKDLDEDAARVLDTVARIQRWLRLEPVARRLTLVARAEAPSALKVGPKGGKTVRWVDSNTRRDSEVLLEAVRREPADAAAADALVVRLLWQLRWHHRLATVWKKVGDSGNRTLAGKLLKLDGLLGDDSVTQTRELAKQDELDAELDAFVNGPAAALDIAFSAPPTPPDPAAEAGITPVRWSASPNLFTGWATLDAQSYGQLSRRAASSARALAWPNLRTEWRAFGFTDVCWSLVILALSCIVYGMSKYGDTWGTPMNLAEAFIAGLLGTVAVKWAALPIFQSIRLRAAASGSTPDSEASAA